MSQDVITVGSTMRILLLYRVSLAGTAQNAHPTLKDPKFWTAEEKKTQKIDRLSRSLLIQGIPNDIYPLIHSNKTAKDLCDALERQMRGSEYGEQDRKAKCGYKKDNCELNYKFLNNLQPKWKQYGTLMRQTKNLMDINIDALYNILKQNQGDVNDALGYKKKVVVVTSDPLALVAEKTKAFNRRKFYSKPTNNNLRRSSTSHSANKKQEFVKSDDKKVEKKDYEKKRDMSKVKCYNCKKEGHFAKDCKKAVKDYNYYKTNMFLAKKDSDKQIEKVLSDSEESSSSAEETIAEVAYYTSESESESEFETSEYYDNSTNYGLFVNNDDDQEIFHDAIESVSDNFIENHIDSQKDYDKSEVDHNDSEEKEHLFEKETTISELEGCVSNKDVEIEKCLERLNECENKLHKIEQMNHTIHMIMPSKDTLYNGKKGIGFENPRYFEKAKDIRPSLYDEKISFSDDYFQEVINPDFEKIDSPFQQTSSLKPYVLNVILEKIIIDLEDEAVSLLEKEKANLETIESLKSKGFESSENAISKSKNQSENDCQVVEKECDKVENSKVITSRMFKLNLDTFSSVKRPKQSCVIWKEKGSSNTSNVDLSYVSHSKLNKDVKRYSRKHLLSCNKFYLGETSCAYVCNDAINVSCNSRLCDSFDENNLFIFDDESVRISPVSKMPFKKKPRDSLNVRSKRNSNQSLPRTMYRWLSEMKLLAEPIAEWIPKVERCSKHMTGNRALLTNFVEKFLGTVRFGNNDFAVIAGYGDVVIWLMTIKKVYYVEGLRHNLFSVGQFCDKGLEVTFRKSTCFVRNEDGVDLLTGDRSSNLYTIALNEVASNSSTCLLEKASYLQSWLWHQRLSHLKFATINNLVKNSLV
nr:integrase, catalytic region, zinc finger, CCHC-type, peptidase aspartic, catalytic [Tanacetum cinerariifolium]